MEFPKILVERSYVAACGTRVPRRLRVGRTDCGASSKPVAQVKAVMLGTTEHPCVIDSVGRMPRVRLVQWAQRAETRLWYKPDSLGKQRAYPGLANVA
jgi:hypothetical protein